jgi:hypothetical protein
MMRLSKNVLNQWQQRLPRYAPRMERVWRYINRLDGSLLGAGRIDTVLDHGDIAVMIRIAHKETPDCTEELIDIAYPSVSGSYRVRMLDRLRVRRRIALDKCPNFILLPRAVIAVSRRVEHTLSDARYSEHLLHYFEDSVAVLVGMPPNRKVYFDNAADAVAAKLANADLFEEN